MLRLPGVASLRNETGVSLRTESGVRQAGDRSVDRARLPAHQAGTERRTHGRWVAGPLAMVLLCLPVLIAAQAAGAVADRARATDAFVHESWSVADGLPVNSVNALLQSRDGYIWIGTFDGLVRFDGVRFTVFNSSNAPNGPPRDRNE